jgi:hypothetical protein
MLTQRSRMSRTQSRFIGRNPGPDSPPAITQSMPDRSREGSEPRRGSSDRNLVQAGTWRSTSARQQYSSFSIEVPTQALGSGHGGIQAGPVAGLLLSLAPGAGSRQTDRPGTAWSIISVAAAPTWRAKLGSASRAASRLGRLVRTWKVCRSASAITAHTCAANGRLTRACPTSDMLLTNTVRGWRQASGSASASGCMVAPNPGPEVRGSPSFWYLGWPIAFSRRARVSA